MKKLGLIGGTSYHSTIDYYRMINEKVGERIGTDKNPELILYSLNIALMRSGDRQRIQQEYLRISKLLVEAGADGIMICANTPHLVFDFVQPQITIPILHIAEAIGQKAQQNGLSTLGILGTKPTVKMGFIADYLKDKFSINTVTPDEKNVDQVHQYISKELTQGIFKQTTRDYFLDQMNQLANKGAQGMILGCTELPLLIKNEMTDHLLIDTTGLHVDLGVKFILDAN